MLTQNEFYTREYLIDSGYMEKLKAKRISAQLEREKKNRPLEQIINDWHSNLPVSEKQMPFHMDFFVKLLGRAPSVISGALVKAGWQKVRIWKGNGPYRRKWVPPA